MRATLAAAVIVFSAALLARETMTAGQSATTTPMNPIAERYVKLVLAVGQHEPAYVDAYYGPEAWKAEAGQQKRSLAQIADEAAGLIRSAGPAPANVDPMSALRHEYLVRQ